MEIPGRIEEIIDRFDLELFQIEANQRVAKLFLDGYRRLHFVASNIVEFDLRRADDKDSPIDAREDPKKTHRFP